MCTHLHEKSGNNRPTSSESERVWVVAALNGCQWFGLVFVLAAIMAGCATGKTEFKVMKATPTPGLEVVATEVPALQPIAELTPSTQPQQTTIPENTALQYTVQQGDSLWRICRRLLGDPLLYSEVATRNQIQNPDLIQPGQILHLNQAKEAVSPEPMATIPIAQSTPALAQTPGMTQKPVLKKEATVFPERSNKAFGVGEKLLFSVEYFGISAGYATLSVEEGPKTLGRPTMRLVATARSHPAFEWIFVVRDRIESVFDSKGLFSWRYEKHLREGGYSNDSYMVYDQVNRKVIKDEGRTVLDAPPWVQDVVSEFYYYRALNVSQVGVTTTFAVVADDGKSYELLVKTIRKETIQVPAGKFNCIVVEPLLKFEGLFQQKGKVQIWLTDDQRQVPVLIKTAIVIGTIDIILRDAEVVDVQE